MPTTQTLTTTAAFNNINSSPASSSSTEDEISKKLPKEILLRILSYLDVVSLCRCAQVSNIKWAKKTERQQRQCFENFSFDYGSLYRRGTSSVLLLLSLRFKFLKSDLRSWKTKFVELPTCGLMMKEIQMKPSHWNFSENENKFALNRWDKDLLCLILTSLVLYHN